MTNNKTTFIEVRKLAKQKQKNKKQKNNNKTKQITRLQSIGISQKPSKKAIKKSKISKNKFRH
jgi:hypothetical protein